MTNDNHSETEGYTIRKQKNVIEEEWVLSRGE